MVRRFIAVSFLTLTCCASWSFGQRTGVDVLVLAPHPDDEVLMAGGVIAEATARGLHVEVVVVTNGDLSCARDGRVRQAETVAALGRLGVPEHRVRFLGYPDGHLERLRKDPLEPLERIGADGTCARGNVTWATRGLGGVDEHTRRTGAPGPYTATALTEDLTAVLEALKPRDVYLPHGIDTHPDHAMTYVFFRRALDRLGWTPTRVHRSVVHASDACWPSDCVTMLALDMPTPALPGCLRAYAATERVPVDGRQKLSVIGAYQSQLDGPLERDWLASFARADEAFYVERYVREGTRWKAVPEVARAVPCEQGDGRVECRARLPGDVEEASMWDADGFARCGASPP
ncbi:MAG: PIG-L family deacetylase [Myxococcaceae bacterium]|jgi:LmbE family N-acetylglucosaminyl deacetylase|nr:PIG-L family deacetylase [Myxococcaceae bacterium]